MPKCSLWDRRFVATVSIACRQQGTANRLSGSAHSLQKKTWAARGCGHLLPGEIWVSVLQLIMQPNSRAPEAERLLHPFVNLIPCPWWLWNCGLQMHGPQLLEIKAETARSSLPFWCMYLFPSVVCSSLEADGSQVQRQGHGSSGMGSREALLREAHLGLIIRVNMTTLPPGLQPAPVGGITPCHVATPTHLVCATSTLPHGDTADSCPPDAPCSYQVLALSQEASESTPTRKIL